MKILGIAIISPLWKDVFNNINIEKLSIFSESFINKSNNFAYKTYSYPNIIYQETYKKINKKNLYLLIITVIKISQFIIIIYQDFLIILINIIQLIVIFLLIS